MKNVKWVIEDFDQDNSFDLLANEVKRQGYACELIKYEPFESGNYDIFDKEDAPIIFQGSLNLAKQLKRQKSWIPGPWCTEEKYKCSTYYAYWGEHLLNSEYIMMPLKELERRMFSLFKEYGDFFVRPDSGFKTFNGQVVAEHRWIRDLELLNFYNPSPETLVIVSPLQKITSEWRFIVADKKVITGSQYRQNFQKKFENTWPQEAFDLAQEIASGDFQPDPAYTLDIALTNEGRYFLVEANSFSCAGLYKCDMSKIVEAVTPLAYKEWSSYKV